MYERAIKKVNNLFLRPRASLIGDVECQCLNTLHFWLDGKLSNKRNVKYTFWPKNVHIHLSKVGPNNYSKKKKDLKFTYTALR